MSNSNSINNLIVEELKELMEEDFPELVHTFLDDTENGLHAIESAINNIDAKVLREESHGLKGSSSNLGADKLSEISYELEKAGCTENFEQTKLLFEQLKSEHLKVQLFFNSII